MRAAPPSHMTFTRLPGGSSGGGAQRLSHRWKLDYFYELEENALTIDRFYLEAACCGPGADMKSRPAGPQLPGLVLVLVLQGLGFAPQELGADKARWIPPLVPSTHPLQTCGSDLM